MTVLRTAVIGLALGAVTLWAGATEGKEIYAKSCKSCHGAEGQGNPAIAKAMKVELRSLASPEVQSQSDAELKDAITKGKGKMKPITNLTPKQVDDVVAYIRTLKK